MIYLDFAATTPCDPEVVEAMLPFFTDQFANASSVDHQPGARVRRAVEEAREHVAILVDANPEDVVFTSGSTEANNMALSLEGLVMTSATEHPSILEPALNRGESNVRVLRVDTNGLVDVAALRESLTQQPASLISVMHTNNETGAQNHVAELGATAQDFDVPVHSDLTQGVLLGDVSLKKSLIEAVSISAHKIYGPKGIGALIARPTLRRRLITRMRGGGHERGLRSGTLNVPGIIGFGAAARLAFTRKQQWRDHVKALSDLMYETISRLFEGSTERNADSHQASHILSLRLCGVSNRALLRSTSEQIAFALGSACATTKNEASYVLRAMGLTVQECNETIRLSFGSPTTVGEVDESARLIAAAANRLLDMVA